MSTSIVYGETRAAPGSPAAKTSSAAAVIALATAIAGTALVGGIATGSAIEAPAEPRAVTVTQPGDPTTPPITATSADIGRDGPAIPLQAN